jgi:RNA polymerase sigma factor (sigma-70 family)
MQTGRRKSPLAPLRRALARREGGGLSDAELLGRFLARHDEAAFEVLVRRHGAMVLGVCRRVLGHAQDAEDAFQATFLILVRRAAAIRKRDAVGHWLYGVAYRTALEARAAAARRHATEKQVSHLPEPAVGPADPAGDLRAVLDAELARLPDKYCAALVLCDLQGHARREAARQLGIPEGTLSSRLAAGRRLLAERLGRRGVTLSAAALASTLSAPLVSAAVPAPLVQATVGAAVTFAEDNAGTAAASANVLFLTRKVVSAMTLAKLKIAVPFLLAVILLGAGAGSIWSGASGREPGAGGQPAERRTEPAAAAQTGPATARLVPWDGPQGAWTLHFKWKDPRVLTVDIPGRGKKAIWYLWYEVVNPTGEPRLFIPDFELVIPGKKTVHRDELIPQAEDAIARVEDPTGRLSIKNSVTMAAEPIAPARAGAPPRPVVGVAIWADVPPDASRFTVFVSGLSNGWVPVVDPVVAGKDEAPVVGRKTLRLNFKRVGRQVEFVPPAEWVYRLTKLKTADQGGKGSGVGRQPDAGPGAKSEAEWLKADIDQVRRGIAELERQARHWEKEREQQAEWVRALYQLQLLRARLLELEARLREIREGRASPPDSGRGPEVRGKIQKVQGDLLSLSVGADDGVRRGERLEIFRLQPRPEYVGRAEILEVQPHSAVARLLRRSPTQGPRVGDEVARQIR